MNEITDWINRFQFHLVRLKVQKGFSLLLIHSISIPLGTIKRNLTCVFPEVSELFQFHLVRLKVSELST